MKTKYSDLIEIRESAIAFKIHPENGDWRDFIPNGQFNDVLRKVTNAVYNNNADFHKPFWIAGTYGSGKSHAGAVLKHLLCDKVEDIREYVEREYKDDSLALLRSDILNLRSKKRLFPVSLYSNENMAAAEDLPFVLQRVIVDALKAAGIEFEVQTDFDNYINDINKDSEFWSLVIDRDAQLKALAPTTDVLIDKLHDCDTSVIRHIKNALRKQNRVVPLHSDSLEDWIFEVQDKLAAQGVYDGLLILWDEFTDVIKSSFGLSILVTLQELLQTDLSVYLKDSLMNLDNPEVDKFVSLFPIQGTVRISVIRDSLNGIKEILPEDLFEETRSEVTEICDDYKWRNSKDGKLVLQIEDWIKEARLCVATDFHSEHIYIGRSFIEPVSLIVGGYVKELRTKAMIESCLNDMNPPIAIEYRISSCY